MTRSPPIRPTNISQSRLTSIIGRTRHLLILKRPTGVLAATGGALSLRVKPFKRHEVTYQHAVRKTVAVGRRAAAEVPPLHDSLEALPLAGPAHVDQLTRDEVHRRDLGSHGQHSIGRHLINAIILQAQKDS